MPYVDGRIGRNTSLKLSWKPTGHTEEDENRRGDGESNFDDDKI